jgi:hypothetical protein
MSDMGDVSNVSLGNLGSEVLTNTSDGGTHSPLAGEMSTISGIWIGTVYADTMHTDTALHPGTIAHMSKATLNALTNSVSININDTINISMITNEMFTDSHAATGTAHINTALRPGTIAGVSDLTLGELTGEGFPNTSVGRRRFIPIVENRQRQRTGNLRRPGRRR